MNRLLDELVSDFRTHFGRFPVLGARAPGRVNLIGEHTDYNDGWVLPCALDRSAVALAAPRVEAGTRVWARDLGEEVEIDLSAPTRSAGWGAYVEGVLRAAEEEGFAVGGLDLLISSRVPLGSGLSSSAALCVSVAGVAALAAGRHPDPAEWARVAHRGESHFAGVGCGILDHFASAFGRRDCALRIDCRSQQVSTVRLPPGRIALLVAHSGVTRKLAGGAYQERVAECRAALEAARTAGLARAEANALRDFGPPDLPRLEGVLPDRLFRRLRHVVTENARVLACCEALEAGDLLQLGAILADGQRSLREDYEVSTPELDFLCEAASDLPGAIGSRLTGAGFGGCTLHLVECEAAASVSERLAARFEKRFGRRPPIVEARPSDGASEVAMGHTGDAPHPLGE